QGGEGPDPVGLRARVVLAEALAANGMRDEARTVLDYFPGYYEGRYDALQQAAFDAEKLRDQPEKARPLSQEMTLIARALRLYVELSPLDHEFLRNAYQVVEYARDLDPGNWEALVEFVRVTRVQRETAIAKAHKAKGIAERANPEIADLYAEVAKSVVSGFNEAEARELAETALRINPRHADARAIAARVLLEDNEYPAAYEHIRRGLETNPRHRDLLALDATLTLLRGDEEGFEAGMTKVLGVDSKYGEAFHLAGLVVAARQRRYDRGVELVRRGLKIDPMNFDAHATLGIFLANLGRAHEALESLEASRKLIPYSHPVRDNFQDVLRYVTGAMTEERTEHFVIRVDPAEREIVHFFLPPLLEACWADMVKRYGFTPRSPVLVEVFKKAEDFSVRTLGLPGIPALGACFGGLITLDSPQALPPGQFLWASTARHEFAHVISLQLSDGQVPRWFTEGLSVLEEAPLDSGWGRNAQFEKEMFDAYHTGTLPEVGTFDAMFRGPRVAYAYYVGGWMLRFLRERSGEAGIVKALRLYGEDRPMEAVFREAFGLELGAFDQAFHEFTGARVGKYRLMPDYGGVLASLRARVAEHPDDGEALLKVAWAYYQRGQNVDAGAFLERALAHLPQNDPAALLLQANLSLRAGRPERARPLLEAYFAAGGEDHHARMTMAGLHRQAGEEEKAVEALRKAKEDFPVRASGTNPYALLRAYYQSKGLEAEALRELEEQAGILSQNIDLRLELAREYARLERRDDAIRALEEALAVTTFHPRVHKALLPLYKAAGRREEAIRSARCVVALLDDKVSDEAAADAWLDLAELCWEDGKREEARAALGEAQKNSEELPRLKELKERFDKE
ncbi:MAG: tetratricopeptide repeat protein, partial [Planctomycetota bacterium]